MGCSVSQSLGFKQKNNTNDALVRFCLVMKRDLTFAVMAVYVTFFWFIKYFPCLFLDIKKQKPVQYCWTRFNLSNLKLVIALVFSDTANLHFLSCFKNKLAKDMKQGYISIHSLSFPFVCLQLLNMFAWSFERKRPCWGQVYSAGIK